MRLSSLLWLLSFLLAFSLLLSCSSLYVDRAALVKPAYTVPVFSDPGDGASTTEESYAGEAYAAEVYAGEAYAGELRQAYTPIEQAEQRPRDTSGDSDNTSRKASRDTLQAVVAVRLRASAEPTICRIARGMSGCEKRGNRGYWPDRWNRHIHNPPGTAYCAAAVSFLLDSCRARSPTVRSGLARSFRTKDSFSALDVLTGKRTVPAGCIIGWNLGSTINGHTGISMERWKATEGSSWQANSTFAWCKHGSGSERDGGGWGIKQARIEPYAYLRIRWFTTIVH